MSHIWVKPVTTLNQSLLNEFDNSVFESCANSSESMIVLAPHIGNWEMANIYLNQQRPLTAMFQPLSNPKLNNFILNARQRVGSILVPTNSKGVAKMKKTLVEKSGMVAFLPDQVPVSGPGGVFAPFFHHQALTMTLAHKLALKTGVKVFICVVYQRENGFAVCVEPINEAFYSSDAVQAASALNKDIEKMILRAPEQYQWEYKRYREQPEGVLSPYKYGAHAFQTKKNPNRKRNR